MLTCHTVQEAVIFAACNRDIHTTHFASLDKFVRENNIDASRVWNLYESGATIGKEFNGSSACKRRIRRYSTSDMKIAQFRNIIRVTTMASIRASGHCAPPVLFFKKKLFAVPETFAQRPTDF